MHRYCFTADPFNPGWENPMVPPGTYSPRHHRCLCLHLFLSFRLSCHRPEHLGRFRQGICQPLHLPCISGHGEENTFRNNLCHDPKQHERFPENSVPAKLVLVYPYKMSRLNVQKILYKNVQLICRF